MRYVLPVTTRCSVETQFFRLLNRLVEPYIRAGWASPRFVPGGLVVLETKGRRTARRSKVPLAAIRIQDRIVVSTFRGDRSQWVKNASANPEVRYWLRGRARRATAHVISAEHRTRSKSDLPPTLRWLVPTLAPYTYAGWAFAVLSPQRDAGRHAPAKTSLRGVGRRVASR
jgi:deazaflavin-dependent oxidoreductase (nitroreductase family)